jgi:hypothetical protein
MTGPGKAAVLTVLRETGLRTAASRLGMEIELGALTAETRDGELLISTVPAGAADFYAERPRFHHPGPATVLDAVYHPRPAALEAMRAAGQAELSRRAAL